MRLYTIEQARAVLPTVIPVLESLRGAITELREMQAGVHKAGERVAGNGHLAADPFTERDGLRARMREIRHTMGAATAQLVAWGIEIKDAERGLIDFRSEREGKVVYLCYLLGESDIAYWHTLEGGFTGRQPL